MAITATAGGPLVICIPAKEWRRLHLIEQHSLDLLTFLEQSVSPDIERSPLIIRCQGEHADVYGAGFCERMQSLRQALGMGPMNPSTTVFPEKENIH